MALTKTLGYRAKSYGFQPIGGGRVATTGDPTLTASAVGAVCTVVASWFPPSSTFTVRWGDSQNSDHPTDGAGTGSWQHTYGPTRAYTITARPVADPNTVIAATTITIV